MTFLVWVYKSPDFAQTQLNCVQSHDCITTTFRISGSHEITEVKQGADKLVLAQVTKRFWQGCPSLPFDMTFWGVQ